MPKKTRREKHTADIHRMNVRETPSQVTYQFQSAASHSRTETIAVKDADIAVIKHDLGKTVMLAAVALTAEIVLSRIIH